MKSSSSSYPDDVEVAVPTSTTTRRRLEIEKLKLQTTKDLLSKARLQLSKPTSILIKSPRWSNTATTTSGGIDTDAARGAAQQSCSIEIVNRELDSVLAKNNNIAGSLTIIPGRTISSPTSPEQQFYQDLLLANATNKTTKTETSQLTYYDDDCVDGILDNNTTVTNTTLSPLIKQKQLVYAGDTNGTLALAPPIDASNGHTATISVDNGQPHQPYDHQTTTRIHRTSAPLPMEATLDDLALLEQAARIHPDRFESDIAVYQVRRPYLSYCSNESFWVSDNHYSDTATVKDSTTLEVAAHIKADNSVLVVHHGHCLKHCKQNGEIVQYPSGAYPVEYRTHGIKSESGLRDIVEEALSTRDTYCSSLVSVALVLEKQTTHPEALMDKEERLKLAIELLHASLSKLIAFATILATLPVQVMYLIYSLVYIMWVLCKWICFAVGITVFWWCCISHNSSSAQTNTFALSFNKETK